MAKASIKTAPKEVEESSMSTSTIKVKRIVFDSTPRVPLEVAK